MFTGRRDVLGIVSLQCFQGNWELDQPLATILGKSLDELKTSADQQVKHIQTVQFMWQIIQNNQHVYYILFTIKESCMTSTHPVLYFWSSSLFLKLG